jgi:hypothetical protein
MVLAAAKREGFGETLRALQVRLVAMVRHAQKELAQPHKHRKGRHSTLHEFLDSVYNHDLLGESEGGRECAWLMLDDILKTVDLGQTTLQFLISRGDKSRLVLFPHIQLTQEHGPLIAQAEIWTRLLAEGYLEFQDVKKMHDFSQISMVNFAGYLHSLLLKI